jgi:hypothetical protein
MFSQKIYVEIARLTQKALQELHSGKTIDQVTIILGYMQMSARNITGYDAELRAAIERLLKLARAENRQELTDALEGLGRDMDQELAP